MGVTNYLLTGMILQVAFADLFFSPRLRSPEKFYALVLRQDANDFQWPAEQEVRGGLVPGSGFSLFSTKKGGSKKSPTL